MPSRSRRLTKLPSRMPALPRHQIFLALVASDRTFRPPTTGAAASSRPVWLGKCIHCQPSLWVDIKGNPGANGTLEHIVPSSLGGTGAANDLALACARCNQQKGTRLDVLGLDYPRLQTVIDTLQKRRRTRWRDVPAAFDLTLPARVWLKIGTA